MGYTHYLDCPRRSSRRGHCLSSIQNKATTGSSVPSAIGSHCRRRCRCHQAAATTRTACELEIGGAGRDACRCGAHAHQPARRVNGAASDYAANGSRARRARRATSDRAGGVGGAYCIGHAAQRGRTEVCARIEARWTCVAVLTFENIVDRGIGRRVGGGDGQIVLKKFRQRGQEWLPVGCADRG